MNRYQKCIVEADRIRQARQAEYENNRLRWNNILRYLPYDELFTASGKLRSRGSIMRRAAGVFKSRWSNDHSTHAADIEVSLTPTFGRDVERDTFLSMLEDALKNYHASPLTVSQQETVVLDRMAKEINQPSTVFISNVLSITVQAAKQRLARARGKTYTLDDDFDIIEVSKAMQETPRYCPFCAEQSKVTVIPVATNPMCWEHHKRFNLKNDFGFYPRKEFERVVMQSHKDYWQAVRDTIDANRNGHQDKVIALPVVAAQRKAS